jgi:hypothetical protein
MSESNKSACVSRRTVLIAAAGAAPLLALGATGANNGKRCDNCNLFVAPNSCKSVAGEVAPSGWCALWVKKAG